MDAGGSSSAARGVAPIMTMLWQQTRAEFLKLWRNPAFSVASLALPVVFFAFFGLPNVHSLEAGVNAGQYLLASFAAYGTISVMLFSFGAGVAAERGQRMHVLMRATPLRPAVYLLARLVTALAFTLLMLVILFAFGALAGGIHLSAGTWTALTVRLLLGAIPFIALGFAIGYLAEPNAAVPITNISFLVLSFASGLFLPVQKLPDLIQRIAPYLPTNRLGQLVWDAVGARTPDTLISSILWLVGYGLVFAVVAIRAYGREQARSFA